MSNKPPLRLYQFRLSTILLLVGIVAWGMAFMPRIHFDSWEGRSGSDSVVAASFDFALDKSPQRGPNQYSAPAFLTVDFNPTPTQMQNRCVVGVGGALRRLGLVLLPLAAFITWQLSGAIAALQKQRRGQTNSR